MNQPIALFPLTAHVFPKGKMRLRIFEPRYVRMVKQACSEERPFAMMMLNTADAEDPVLPIGTVVKVVDFEQLEDGILGITIEGVHKIRMLNQWVEDDGLRVANVEAIHGWPASEESNEATEQLSENLQQIFDEYPEISQLYIDEQWHDCAWVCQRWLELLPIDAKIKQTLVGSPTHIDAQHYLHHIIIDPTAEVSRKST